MSAAFEQLLTAGKLEATLSAIEDMPQAQRSKAFDVAIACCNKWFVGDYEPRPTGSNYHWVWQSQDGQRECAALAALVLGTPAGLASRLPDRSKGSVGYGEEALATIQRFKPSWLTDGGLDQILEANKFSFPLVVQLREGGLCRQPSCSWYKLQLIEAARRWRRRDETFLQWLDARPILLKEDLRLVFEIEGSGECSLAALDKYGGSWATTLTALIERGDLERAEMLDLTLEVLSRDYASFRAGWFSRFHESLKPTLDERASRQAGYERLLGAMVPQTAAWALKALEVLAKKKRLAASTFVDAVEPVMSAPAKGTVQRALKILERLLKGDPELANAIAELCLIALTHPEAAVQQDAVALFRAAGGESDPDLAARLQDVAPALAATVRRELGTDEAQVPAPQAAAAWTPSNPLGSDHALAHPQTLEDGLDVIARAFEHPTDVELYELALDFISRTDPKQHPEFEKLAGPVSKRGDALIKRFAVEHILQVELCRVVLAWTKGEKLKNDFYDKNERSVVERFLIARTDELVVRVLKGDHGQLLSTPTHRYGYVDPGVMKQRIRARAAPLDTVDAVLALHRLGPKAAAEHMTELEKRVSDAAAIVSAAAALDPTRLVIGSFAYGEKPYIWHRLKVFAEPKATPKNATCFGEQLVARLVLDSDVGGLLDWVIWSLPHAPEWTAAAEALDLGGYRFDQAT
ncbi:MAG TPA: DUF6493 family protein, partial [Polyangiaceae bacterium]|nr:DUF6493 family protein [Polyangiaceae bacterium]